MPPDHALGRSRGGFGTKLHPVVDSNGVPLAEVVTAGRAHESKSVEAASESVRIKRTRPGA